MLLPCFSLASSWKDTACGINKLEEQWCKEISNNYKEPYCVTSFYDNDRDASDVNYAGACIWPALTNKISSIKNKEMTQDDFTTRDVVEQYCLALLWKSDSWRIYFSKPNWQNDSWDWQQTFDSHQSLFLYALCSSFTESWSSTKSWNRPFINDNVLIPDVYKWDIVDLLKLQQMSEWKNLCSLDDDYGINDCDMAIYATKIYAGIMSDLLKIKYAQVLDVNTTKNFDSEWRQKVVEFMSWYYRIHRTYDELKTEYPKTVSILESNQKFYKKVLDTVKIIDNSKLADLSIKSRCPVVWNMIWMDFVACALHSSQWDGFSLSPSFVTLFYNEILHYRQFVTFYERWLQERIDIKSKDKAQEKNVRIWKSKIEDLKWYFDVQMEATEWAQRGFEEFNMTYPLHIWITLHIEKGEKFRNNSLSKVITSFYSLSEKLQNVQLPAY